MIRSIRKRIRWLKSLDRTALSTESQIHFDNQAYNKTYLGGCCTLIAYVAIAVFCLMEISQIIWEKNNGAINNMGK